MPAPDIISKDPVEELNSKFEYVWKTEKAKSRLTAEHYFVNWTIENLKLLILEEHKSVLSPVFYLDSSKTEWNFEIYPNGLCNEVPNIDIFVYRSDDSGPLSVGLTYRFGVLQTEGKTMWLEEKKIENFEKGTCSVVSVEGHERSILSKSKFEYSETFTITCEMYVIYAIPCYNESLLTPADYDLLNFSFDFSKLMMAVEIADYRVKVPGFNINTHKAILAARSATFREMLQKDSSSTEVNLDDFSYDSMRRVLYFMYSGNFSMALKGEPPSIGLYECAQKFAVKDLMTLLFPKSLTLLSSLNTEEISFTWSISNFTKRSSATVTNVRSPPFGVPCRKSPEWYLIVNYEKEGSQKLSIFVETTREIKALHSILKISLIDGEGNMQFTHITNQFKKGKEKFGFPEFLNNFPHESDRYDLLVNDALKVHCELIFVMSEGVFEAHDVSVINKSLSFFDSYRNLSNDLLWLWETSSFSDVTIITEGTETFKVHKPVLFARSRKFYSKFLYYNKSDRILEVHNVDPDTLQLMLKHAYSGMLEPMFVEDTLRLYKAADLYVFRFLSLMTARLLASQINIDNFFELLSEGRKFADRYLEEKCMIFARENSGTILETVDWDKYRSENQQLCDFLNNFLNDVETLKQ